MADQAEIKQFLEQFGPLIAGLSITLREFIRDTLPEADERIHSGWKVISYGERPRVISIAPHKNWVNLQFYLGTSLADPASRLEGTGKTMRHVKIRSEADLDEGLRDMIKAAAS